jgi:hypothetical protein
MTEWFFVENGSSDDITSIHVTLTWTLVVKHLVGTTILRNSPLLGADPRVNTPDSRNAILKAAIGKLLLPVLPVVKR